MASMNSDIRFKNRNQAKVVAIIVGVAAATLSLAFGLSFLPSFASAHTAVVSPVTVEEGGVLDIVINADDTTGDFSTGETVKGVLWGIDDNTTPSCADISDGDVPGTLEFQVNAPHTDGLHTFYYKLTDSNDCTGHIGDLQFESDSFEVLPDEPTVVNNVTVTPGSMQGWAFINDQTNGAGSGSLVAGPLTAPLGTGSANLTATTTSDGQILAIAAAAMKLANIKTLSYATYQDAANTSNAAAIALQLNVDKDITDADTSWQGRHVYEPYLNNGGTVALGSWNTWDAINSGAATWWFSKPSLFGNQCGQGAPCTLTQILSLFPNIGIHPTLGAIVLKAGSGWDAFSGNVDDLVMGTKVGVNSTTTTYDFEPAPAPVAPSCDNNSTFDTFTDGSVNGQGGWTITGAYDQAVVSNLYGFPTFGCKTLRMSDAQTSGSFGDWLFTPSTANEAGETAAATSTYSGGARQNHFEAQFDIASAASTTVQTGLHISVSPDRGDGARMSYLRFEDQADGIHVFFDDVQGTSSPSNFVETDIATLDRAAAHTIKFSIYFIDGDSNDIVKIYVDGALAHTGTTWENYFRYDSEQAGSGNQVPTVDSLILQARGTATPADAGKGFIFDNFSISTSLTCASGQHVENNACVNDTTSGGGNPGGSNPGNGGGNGIPGLIGVVNTNPTTGGLVLGTSTEDLPAGCSIYLSTYLKQGNSGEQVKKLQTFLNANVAANLPVTGVFGPLTFAAVKAFQLAHWDEVLAPWVPFGLPSDHTPTGYVYKTTQRMINLVQCQGTIAIPQPQLP